jgi:perosamine synthetase
VRPGDRVVLPSYCCAAVLNAVHYCDAEPVLADADPETANLDPADVRRRLRARTRAIIVPHLFGRPAPVREIRRLGVPVVEDCAMSLGGEGGRLGDVSVFSFYATKVMATGHGGMVVARDRRRSEVMRDLVDYDNRDDYRVRFNYRMSGLVAAVGREQLRRVPEFVKRRRAIADYYYGTLGLGPLPRGHVFYRFIVRVGDVGRFVRFMAARGVECKRPVFRPLHRYLSRAPGEFPGAEELDRSVVSVPIYPALRPAERDRVASALRAYFP